MLEVTRMLNHLLSVGCHAGDLGCLLCMLERSSAVQQQQVQGTDRDHKHWDLYSRACMRGSNTYMCCYMSCAERTRHIYTVCHARRTVQRTRCACTTRGRGAAFRPRGRTTNTYMCCGMVIYRTTPCPYGLYGYLCPAVLLLLMMMQYCYMLSFGVSCLRSLGC